LVNASEAGKMHRQYIEERHVLDPVKGIDKVMPMYGDEIISDGRAKPEFQGKTKRTRLISEAIEQATN